MQYREKDILLPLLYNFDTAKLYNSNPKRGSRLWNFFKSQGENDIGVREKLPYVFTVLGCLVEEGLITDFQIQKKSLKEVYNKIVLGKIQHYSTVLTSEEIDYSFINKTEGAYVNND